MSRIFINCLILFWGGVGIINASDAWEDRTISDASLRFHAELRQALERIAPTPNPVDPNEPMNREIFQFNSWVTHRIIQPTMNWIGAIIPEVIHKAGANFYSNLIEPELILTNSLAGNYTAVGNSTFRFALNSTVGVAGIWDPADSLGYPRAPTGLTESLCTAGLDPGNYLVLPLIGPTTTTNVSFLASIFLMEWYLLETYISPIIAGIAGLRYVGNIPQSETKDPYLMQRADYQNYLWSRCASHLNRKFLSSPRRELVWEDEILK